MELDCYGNECVHITLQNKTIFLSAEMLSDLNSQSDYITSSLNPDTELRTPMQLSLEMICVSNCVIKKIERAATNIRSFNNF
jgi:hypothetical protein